MYNDYSHIKNRIVVYNHRLNNNSMARFARRRGAKRRAIKTSINTIYEYPYLLYNYFTDFQRNDILQFFQNYT